MGAVPARIPVRIIWRPPDVQASEDIQANDHGGPTTLPAMLTDKRALRARMRAVRDAFVAGAPATIAPPPQFIDRLAPGMVVASYIPIGSEADPGLLAQAAAGRGCRLALPHVTSRNDPIHFLDWDVEMALTEGPFGLRQPGPHADEIAPDIILTPLVAFDARLNRLGQGAGHYDRAFAALPGAWRLGIAWSVQQVPTLRADPWDVPLHAIITERGWLNSETTP